MSSVIPLSRLHRLADVPQPALAALKSLALPGLGQWHNGQIDKAVWIFLAFAFVSIPGLALVALVLPPSWTAPLLALALLLALGLWLGAIADAWRAARRAEADADAGLATDRPRSAQATPVWRMPGVTVLILVVCDLIALPLLMHAVRASLVQPFRIPSASMAPTLWPGDVIFADMRYACIACRAPVRRGDVAIFAYPNDRTLLYVKRIVALPGDRVQVDGDAVRINGAPLAEAPGAMPPPAAEVSAGPIARPDRPTTQDFTVPPGQVFALGDHLAHSLDSRHFGTVPLQDVVGRVRQIGFSWGEGGVRWQRMGVVVR